MPRHLPGLCVTLLCGVLLLPMASVAAEAIAIGRYVRVTTGPTASQLNPLEAVITIRFPKGQVDTIGAAADYLLQRSGYTLADRPNADHVKLRQFPLPDVQREFQLVTVIAALDALGGPSYQPRVDHADRTVTYVLRPDEDQAVQTEPKASDAEDLAQGRPRSD